jgi:putative endonuclease
VFVIGLLQIIAMAQHNELGKQGETIACNYLRKLGYTILSTNWRYKHEEVDIIAKQQNDLIFVEVKTRTLSEHSDPTDTITKGKMRHLVDAAEEYVTSRNLDVESRFDVITVVVGTSNNNQKTNPKIEHIKDAFGPEF